MKRINILNSVVVSMLPLAMAHSSSRTRKGSLFYSWFFSYVLVLFLPLIVSLVVYIQAATLIEQEMNRANDALLDQVKYNTDVFLDNLFKMSLRISESKRLQGLLYYERPISDFQYYTIYQVAADLGLQRFSGLRFSNFYIYLKNLKATIGPNGFHDSELQYETAHGGGDLGFSAWTEIMETYHRRRFISLPRKDDRAEFVDTIAYLQTVPELNPVDPPATLVVLVDKESLASVLYGSRLADSGFNLILDGQGQLIASSGAETPPTGILQNLEAFHGDAFSTEIDGIEYHVSERRSDVGEWRYVSFVPRSAYRRNALALQHYAILGFFICILIGVGASYLQSLLRYSPILRLLKIFPDRGERTTVANSRNEFSWLEENISIALRDRERLDERVKSQETTLDAFDFLRAIRGQAILRYDFFPSWTAARPPCFTILSCVVRAGEDFFPGKTEEEKRTLAPLVAGNIIESLMKRRGDAFVAELDERIVCLFRSTDAIEAAATAAAVAKECFDFLASRYHLGLTIGRGGSKDDIALLHESFNESVRAADYRLILGTGRLIGIEEIIGRLDSLEYPLEMEQRLIFALRAGDLDSASSVLEKVFRSNFAEHSISVEMARCLIFNLVSTMIKAIAEIDSRFGSAFWDHTLPLKRLQSCETVEEVKIEVAALTAEVCSFVNANKKSHNVLLKERMLDYIEAELTDPNLCSATIAAELKLNTAYCSRFFKEHVGVGTAEYITRVRVDRAKGLVVDHSLTLERVASLCGFPGSIALIRAFKKLEGMTPGQFRTMGRN